MSLSHRLIEPLADAPVEAAADGRRIARRIRLAGHVQGVGLRPFVYRLAHELGLAGSVQNLLGEVEIRVEGSCAAVERFSSEVISRAPALARPTLVASHPVCLERARDFIILDSAPGEAARVFVPPDAFTCGDCLAELTDPASRRYRYPFINCTQCGPRYTLIQTLPYDRPNTTMAQFALCGPCRQEYESPGDRRFHAEPVACSDCGPEVWLEEGGACERPQSSVRGEAALARAVSVLLGGGILAVKGVGGYHLMCDATSDAAVVRLRVRKRRPGKPLAVMFPQTGPDGLESVRREVEPSVLESRLLVSSARPIVLVPARRGSALAPSIAPGLSEVGIFLPYSPLHHLLLADAARPLVATSGNPSDEPVTTDVAAARTTLTGVADACLHHDRPIARPADDSVVRVSLGRSRTLRLGRGLAPLELDLPWRLERPLLATGGHLKTTVALAWENRVVISPHIGDMGSVRSLEVFVQVVEDLQRLYGVRATEIVCDAHPDYATTQWAQCSAHPVTRILHHHAHASAVAGESGSREPLLVFVWDGAGLGADGTLWGGEAFEGVPGNWLRVASLRPFALPGGDRTARAPWRCAAGVCWELGVEPPGTPPDPAVRAAWRARLNSPTTSSVGRLFDAAAALILGLRETSYEGQAPMLLEAVAARSARAPASAPSLPLREDASGVLRLDWAPLIGSLLEGRGSAAERAAAFHDSLAASIVEIARSRRRSTGLDRVALTGGVFQNVRLTELAHERLTAEGFRVSLGERVPCNDGGLSFGQIIEVAARRHRALLR